MSVSALSRILYIEDEPDLQLLVELALQRAPQLKLKICASLEAALEEATTFDAQLILLDYCLPDLRGVDALQRLQDDPRTRNTPVIFVTAMTGVQESLGASAGDVLDIIAKPFDPLTLAQRIRTTWEDYHGN